MSNQEQTQRDRDLTEALRSGRTARGGAKLLSVLGGVLVILGVIAGGALPLLIAGRSTIPSASTRSVPSSTRWNSPRTGI